MNNIKQVESLLHEVRSPSCTYETIHELSELSRKLSQDELEVAFRRYIVGLIGASIDVMKVKIAVDESQNSILH